MNMDWFQNFKKSLEYIFFVFAFPITLILSGIQGFGGEDVFWFYYAILFVDTCFLLLKEKFKSWKNGNTENFLDYMLWYKCFSILMIIQFVYGVVFGQVDLTVSVLVLIVFIMRFQLYERVLNWEKFNYEN